MVCTQPIWRCRFDLETNIFCDDLHIYFAGYVSVTNYHKLCEILYYVTSLCIDKSEQ